MNAPVNPAGARTVGRRAKRIEDPALLRGKGRFTDDITLPGMLHAAFVRSQYAHANLGKIDVAAALAVPGVHAVYTAETIRPALTRLRMPLGFPTKSLPDNTTPFVLCPKEACFVGEPIAIVIADSRAIAEDAAALVEIDYDPLPVISDARQILAPDAPRARTEASNVLAQFRIAYGDVAGAFAKAAHVFEENLSQHRGGAHSIEGRGIVASYETALDAITVWSSTQMSHDLKFMTADLLGLAESRTRVVAPDVGGGFGAKFLIYPEEIAVAAASKLLGRPVKWIEDRLEHFTGAIQERDQFWDMAIAVDADAKILGIRGRLVHDQGAYTPQAINCAYNAATGVTGPYIVPAYDLDAIVAQTNMPPVIPVRGAGYPEAAYVMERLMDRVARELALDPLEVRRRNFVKPEKMPYEKPLKSRAGTPIVLDSGDYPEALARVVEKAGYADFPKRQAEARKAGRYIGLGIANAVKGTGRGPFESGNVTVSPTGRVTISTGAMPMGQGIKTALAQIAAEQLGVPHDWVDVVAGDTAAISLGVGGFASRQTALAGTSVHLAATEVKQKAIKVASTMLEVAESDLVLRDGRVEVEGVPGHGVTLGEIARNLRGVPGYAIPNGMSAGLESTFNWQCDQLTYANACQAVEVEVDIETGEVRLLRYVALQDSGKMINPMIVEGQVHGGVVHGIGNSLFERMRYDASGQPLTTTFADYLLPTATEIPMIEMLFMESPSPTNPLGVKGVGEGGVIPVAAAIAQAVENALAPFGVVIRDVPISPVELVELIDRGRSGAAAK